MWSRRYTMTFRYPRATLFNGTSGIGTSRGTPGAGILALGHLSFSRFWAAPFEAGGDSMRSFFAALIVAQIALPASSALADGQKVNPSDVGIRLDPNPASADFKNTDFRN